MKRILIKLKERGVRTLLDTIVTIVYLNYLLLRPLRVPVAELTPLEANLNRFGLYKSKIV